MRAMSNKHLLLTAIVAVAACAACGKSEQQKQAEEATKQVQQGAAAMQQGAEQMANAAQNSSQQMANGLQAMAQGFQQMAQGSGAAAKSVDYEQLKALLPDVGGWTKTNPKGEEMSMPVSYSRAEAQYSKDPSHIDLEITDTALSQLLLAPMSIFLNSGFSERSDEGFKRATKVANQPGYEEWNVDSKRGEVTAVVNGRFVVHATGNDVDSIDPVRKVVESVDLSKLAALGNSSSK
jgi:uncharacterized phage infection (PIP) family protein YhgE